MDDFSLFSKLSAILLETLKTIWTPHKVALLHAMDYQRLYDINCGVSTSMIP